MADGYGDDYSVDGMWWINGSWVPVGTWGPPPEPTIKCECGVEAISGKEYAEDKHSEYCPVYKKWKENEERKQKNGPGVS